MVMLSEEQQEVLAFLSELFEIMVEGEATSEAVHSFLRINLNKFNEELPYLYRYWLDANLTPISSNKAEIF